MTRNLVALGGLVLTSLFSGCTVVVGNGNVVDQPREVSGSFTKVVVAGQVDVAVTYAAASSVVVSIDSNLQEYVTVEVREGTLTIAERPNTNLRPKQGSKVRVAMPELDGATVSGSAEMSISGLSGGQAFSASVSGSGNLSGAGLSGVQTLTADVSGSGDLSVSDLTGVQTLSATVTGSGDVSVSGLTGCQSFTANVSGSGNLTASGSGTSCSVDVSGSGNVRAKEYGCTDAIVSVSGSGDAVVNASATVSVTLSGSGNLDLWGSATIVNRSVVGTGEVIRHP